MKINNKGFAVSAVLYSLLLVFALFTMVVLASFDSAVDIVGASNDDIVNGNTFVVYETLIKDQIKYGQSQDYDICQYDDDTWYNVDCDKKITIQTSTGTVYWPKNFCKTRDENTGRCKKYENENKKYHIKISFTIGTKKACDKYQTLYDDNKEYEIGYFNDSSNNLISRNVSDIWDGGDLLINKISAPAQDNGINLFYCAHITNTLTKETKTLHITEMCKDSTRRNESSKGVARPKDYTLIVWVPKVDDNNQFIYDDNNELEFQGYEHRCVYRNGYLCVSNNGNSSLIDVNFVKIDDKYKSAVDNLEGYDGFELYVDENSDALKDVNDQWISFIESTTGFKLKEYNTGNVRTIDLYVIPKKIVPESNDNETTSYNVEETTTSTSVGEDNNE